MHALNNLQRLIGHKTQTTNQPTNQPTITDKYKTYITYKNVCFLLNQKYNYYLGNIINLNEYYKVLFI